MSRHGLSEEDAGLLKGSPEQILDDAAYWANRLKETKPANTIEDDKTNRQVIDDKVDNQTTNPPKPVPKGNEIPWIDKYRQANPAERYKMDQEVLNGNVNPHKK